MSSSDQPQRPSSPPGRADLGAEPAPSGAPRGAPVASPIVVGVSPVTGSRAALQWAVQEARLRRARVRAVMAWRSSGLPGAAPGRPPGQSVVSAAPEQRRAEQALSEYAAEALGEDHDVELRAVEGRARDVLLLEAEEAALLVLDSPAVAKLYDPSARRLAPRIIFSSACPVVVMPPAEPAADADLDDFAAAFAADAAGERSGSVSS
jgi:hypothetical protein